MSVLKFFEFYRAMQQGRGWVSNADIREQLAHPERLNRSEIQELEAVLAARA